MRVSEAPLLCLLKTERSETLRRQSRRQYDDEQRVLQATLREERPLGRFEFEDCAKQIRTRGEPEGEPWAMLRAADGNVETIGPFGPDDRR